MSELNLVSHLCASFCPIDSQSPPLPDDVNTLKPAEFQHSLASSEHSAPESTEMTIGAADLSVEQGISPEHYGVLLDELARTRSLECQHLRRIYQLEKALDQALIYLEELRLKVQDHDDLQAQLAITEDFAYVQQHAIARLKLQIKEQKQTLLIHNLEAQEYDQSVQHLLSQTEQLAKYQQTELDQLKTRIAHDQLEEGQRRSRLEKRLKSLQIALKNQQAKAHKLESEALEARTQSASLEVQLAAAQEQVKTLSIRLAELQTQYSAQYSAQQQQLQAGEAVAAELQDVQAALQRSQSVIAEQNHTIATLERDVALANTEAERLDAERLKHLKEEARWQQRCQELEQACDRHAAEAAELKQQAVDMQEDILRQTRQAGEYEATVQFWKDRYHASQRQLSQLKQVLEQAASDGTPAEHLQGLLQAVQMALLPEGEDEPVPPLALPAPQFNLLDMPEFLLRRQARRTRHRTSHSSHATQGGDTDATVGDRP